MHRDVARALSLRLQSIRIAVFLGALAAYVAFDVLEGTAAFVALGLCVASVIAFFALVGVHRRVRSRERWHEALRALAHQGAMRLERRWEDLDASLPSVERDLPKLPADHDFAVDLDLVGARSLLRLLGPVTSPRGRSTLREWLLVPASTEEVASRQGAVTELAPQIDFRMELAAHGRVAPARDEAALTRFLGWAGAEPWLSGRGWVRWAAWVLPIANVGLGAMDAFGGWGPLWIPFALMQGEVLRRVTARLAVDFADAAQGAQGLAAYANQLRLVSDRECEAELLCRMSSSVGDGHDAAPRRLEALAKLLDTVESRRNMVYVTLALVFLLDVHLAGRLDRWRTRSGRDVSRWLDVIAVTEALSALATLAHDHPDWAYPRWDGAAPRLQARSLGHPLLHPVEGVRNDVDVGPAGSFLLVTGSNMSGKSTLLRAIGVNAVLAGAGGPVCAEELTLPPVRLMTSMRISDDVTRGVSLFMAELFRVRDVVEAARAADAGGPPVLYLLDEMLHGTNTAERRVAARAVLRHLLDVGAIGAVSTHDLTLADAPDLQERAHPVHFREEVLRDAEGTRLTFDYRLRPGLATTRNALRLLEAVGLEVPEDDAGDA